VPRPKILKDARVVPIVLEAEQVELLRRVAAAKKVSISRLVREAIDLYLREEAVRLGLQTVLEQPKQVAPDGQAQLTKLDRIEVEEFEKSLSELERLVKQVYDEYETIERMIIREQQEPGFLDRARYGPKPRSVVRRWVNDADRAVRWFFGLKRDLDRLKQRGVWKEEWEDRIYDVWVKLNVVRDVKRRAKRVLGEGEEPPWEARYRRTRGPG